MRTRIARFLYRLAEKVDPSEITIYWTLPRRIDLEYEDLNLDDFTVRGPECES